MNWVVFECIHLAVLQRDEYRKRRGNGRYRQQVMYISNQEDIVSPKWECQCQPFRSSVLLYNAIKVNCG